MPKLLDRTGLTYGRLTVVGRDEGAGPASNGRRTKWMCVCACGGSKSATGHELSSGDTSSCGCLKKEKLAERSRTHGMTRTGTYRSWQAAKDRCGNPKNDHYPAYGGSGVKMDPEWASSFTCFLADMGPRPAGATLDRVSNSEGYNRDNCRWATSRVQRMNRRSSVVWSGKRRTLKEVSEICGVPRTSLNKHFKRLGDIDEALQYVRERMK